MHQIDNAWAVTAKPQAAPVGSPGWFQKGNPPNLLATVVDYDWANTIQGEILNVVVNGGGLVPNKNDDTQLLQAIQAMIEGVTGVNLDMFVLRAGDTMTGPLITPKLTANTGRIISESAAQPSISLFETVSGLGVGMWEDPANGAVYFGACDITGNPTAAWFGANGSGLTSYFGVSAALAITSGNGRIISRGAAGSKPSLTAYDLGGYAWGMWVDAAHNLGFGPADGSGNAGAQLITINSAGLIQANALTVGGAINANTLTAASVGSTGNLFGGTTYPAYPAAPSFYLHGDGTNNVINFQAGYAFVWSVSSGTLEWMANSASAMSISPIGRMYLSEAIFISTGIAPDFSIAASPGSRGITWATGYSNEWQTSTGIVQWLGPGPQQLMALNPNGSLDIIGRFTVGNDIVYTNRGSNSFAMQWDGTYVYAVVNGTGIALQAVSDERAKQDIAPSTLDNLAAIRSIPLFEYRWKDIADPANPLAARENAPLIPVGFIAQRLHEIFPEAAIVGTEPDEDGDANFWSVDDHTLIASLCGAVRQVASLVDALTARLTVLEAGQPAAA